MKMIRCTLAALTVAMASMLAAQQSAEPTEIVRSTTDELFRLVEAKRETYENDVDELRQDIRRVLLPHIDTMYSGRLVLGRQSRSLSQDKIAAFADALSDLLIRRYADGLLDFRTRDQVEIRPLAGNNTERVTRVKTRVLLDNGKTAPVDYVFHKTDAGWEIFDVIVEGISYVATFRNQIGEQIQREGFDATLAKLQSGAIAFDPDAS
jgi:phospholipid transport system substrate-binding protein